MSKYYNKQKILSAFRDVDLFFKDCHFLTEKNLSSFLRYIDTSVFHNGYDFDCGASKLVILPKNANFVIKLPLTGRIRSGIYTPFTGAISKEENWDYCAVELERYKQAKNTGFEECLAKIYLIGYIGDYPIYLQEKADIFSKKFEYNNKIDFDTYVKSNKTAKKLYSNKNEYLFSKTELFNTPKWITDFYLFYGEDIFLDFMNFIIKNQWEDLHSDNIGYIKNRPVLIDYSDYDN